ncbi:hypothetical protein STCU_08025 [Strigomonas culicis]|uniref:Uncharacterized protein n=1 Tax=Strigomonas culicis TaxID=28005 RepID=S9U280_9TRYP|nr:hypothetical protein STCU_08025 [Strigomonas culicis]|eukprot:EPY22934.1 hypothetical protein STCU_08025 [Strigomonas culicis]
MTERTLLLKTDFLYPYYIVGTDYPSARVFHAAASLTQEPGQGKSAHPDHGSLACVMELPPKHRSSLTTVRMTAVALGSIPSSSVSSNNKAEGAAQDADVGALRLHYAVMGLSNGAVLFHNITLDRSEEFLAVSETQKPIVSIRCVNDAHNDGDGFVFILAENNVVYVLDAKALHRGVMASFKVQTGASALAVASVQPPASDSNNNNVFRVLVAGPTSVLYHVEIQNNRHPNPAGPPSAAKSVLIGTKLLSFASQGNTVDYAWLSACVAPPGAAGRTWQCAVTACAQEGLLRVWDLLTTAAAGGAEAADTAGALGVSEKARIQHYFNPNASAQHAALVTHAQQQHTARCAWTLQCGQRMSTLSALLYPSPARQPSQETAPGAAARAYQLFLSASTFTGYTFCWTTEGTVARADGGSGGGSNADVVLPLAPNYVLYTQDTKAKLVYATLFAAPSNPTAEGPSSDGKAVSFEDDVRVGLVRGRFAFPHFETVTIASLKQEADALKRRQTTRGRAQQAPRAIAAALGFRTASNMEVVEVPASLSPAAGAPLDDATAAEEDASRTDAAQNAFQQMDAHILFIQEKYKRAQRAAMANSESFAAIVPVQAKSIKDQPLQKMTLEERLRYLTLATADDADAVEAGKPLNEAAAVMKRPLALSTVPLYQALHVQDSSAVMELLSISARSAADRKQTLLHLHIRYVLQLLLVLSQRLGVCDVGSRAAGAGREQPEDGTLVVGGGLAAISARSPILEWFHAILHYRGMELYALQQEMNGAKRTRAADRDETRPSPAAQESAGGDAAAEREKAADPLPSSAPKEFLAPIYHQYKQMSNMYDTLAVLHGRLAIFNSVRPQEKYNFFNRERQLRSSNMEMEANRMNQFQAQSRHERLSKKKQRTGGGAPMLNKTNFGGTRDDILFPVMFTEVRTQKAGARVVRVKSRLAMERKRHLRQNTDKAMYIAMRQQAALEKKKATGAADDDDPDAILNLGGGADDDDLDVDGMDLDDLEAMAAMEDEEGEEDKDDDAMIAEDQYGGRRRKGADAADDDDLDDGSSSSDDDAEFSSSSDDALSADYDAKKDLDGGLDLEGGDDDDDSDDDSDEEEEEDDNPYHHGAEKHSSDDELAEDDADSEDGEVHDDGPRHRMHPLHESMREALQEDDDETETERKKHKRIRTD